jgi:predicted O-linked N-acetylglucosamine transferase (SPINDLY family)
VIVVARDYHEANTARLQSRFARAMPDVADRIVWIPRQAYPGYLSLMAAVDVVLDPLHFSGGLTTYDAFSLGRPIVTLPGEFRRGRFTLACYRKMGIPECVAADADDYVNIAVTLATDRDYRATLEERIREASPRLFEDVEAVREYERIFQELIEEARSR